MTSQTIHSKYKCYHTPLNETPHENILRTPLCWKTPKSRNYRVFKPFFPLRSSRKYVIPKHGHKKSLASHHKPPERRWKGWWCYPIKIIVCGWYTISASSTPPFAKTLPTIVVFQASATSNLVATIKLCISLHSHPLCILITSFTYEWKPSEVTSAFVTWQRWKTRTTSFARCAKTAAKFSVSSALASNSAAKLASHFCASAAAKFKCFGRRVRIRSSWNKAKMFGCFPTWTCGLTLLAESLWTTRSATLNYQ